MGRRVSLIFIIIIILFQINILLGYSISKKILSKYTEEDGVLVLKDANYNESLVDFPNIIVQLYAYWSQDAQKFSPELIKAAKALRLNDPPIIIGKIDGASNGIPLTRYKMSKIPTLKLFQHNQTQEIDYKGSLTAPALIKWAKKLCGKLMIEINEEQELEKLKKENELVLTFFAEEYNEKEISILKQIAQKYTDIEITYTLNSTLRKIYNIKANNVALYKHFDEKYNEYNKTIDLNQLSLFIDTYSYPLFMPYDYRANDKIFNQQIPALFLLVDDSEKSKEAENIVNELSKSLKGRILFTISRNKGEYLDLFNQVSEYFQVTADQLPAIRLVGFQGKQSKYKYEEKEIQKKKVEQLISKFRIRKLIPYLKSETAPSDNMNNNVKIATSNNFEELILQSEEDCLVVFKKDDCNDCADVIKKIEKIAKILKQNSGLIIAILNQSKNEIEIAEAKDVPKILFYKSGQKNRKPVEVSHSKSAKEILNWLKDNSSGNLNVDKKIDL